MRSSATFSLLTEPWIRCQLPDGENALLSIRALFDGQHPVRGIRGESPAQDYAVLRVLLAIYWRAHREEAAVAPGETFAIEEWFEDSWEDAQQEEADTVVLEYLDQHEERFDLLHPEAPFMQVADLHTQKDSTSSVPRIIPEAESDYFTMRAGQGRESLSFAEAARWVIYTHAYDYSGIKSGAVGDARVKGGKGYPIGTGWTGMTGGTVLLGSTLRETLVLNTTGHCLQNSEDRPVWEREPDTAAERQVPVPAGPADLATWQTRRIRLFHDGEQVTAVLVSNGDKIPDAGANAFGDPMTPYRYSTNKSKKNNHVYYPRPYDVNRTMWRSLEPLITVEGDPGFTTKNLPPKRPETLSQLARLSELDGEAPQWANLSLVSVEYGPQASSVATTVDSRIEIPVALLRKESRQARRTLLDTAKATGEAAVALGSYAGQLLVAAGGEYAFQPTPTDTLLARLEPEFASWLSQLSVSDLDRHAHAWQNHAREAVLHDAAVLLRGAGPKALAGREISQGEDSSPRIASAGTAYRWLQHKLTQVLPLAAPPETPEKR